MYFSFCTKQQELHDDVDSSNAISYKKYFLRNLKHGQANLHQKSFALWSNSCIWPLSCFLESHFKQQPKDYSGNKDSANADVHFTETYNAFRKFNIVKAMVCGPVKSVDTWKAKDKDNRIIRGIELNYPTDGGMDSIQFKK